MHQLSPNTIIKGKKFSYTIKKVLGQGTFGITYLATVKLSGDLGDLDDIQVCLKEFFMKELNGRIGNTVTSSNNGGLVSEYKNKFKKEALNLSRLKHDNIVKVLESFEANNTAYYSMEFLPSGSLDEYIESKRGLSEKESIRFALQICNALSFMHKNKMLHLDLKPKNIMVGNNGGIKLIDFGLSKQYNGQGEPESSTSVGSGTPGYAPLEQASYRDGNDFPVTMDVYAMGATMFKMLTGKRPPVASYIINDGFPSHELHSKGISSMMCSCIEKAMAARKRERYSSIEALSKCLLEIQNFDSTKKEGSKKHTNNQSYSGSSDCDEQTKYESGKSQDNTVNDNYNGISVFSLTNDNRLYYCNAYIWQCFELKSGLTYDNFYSIYPAKDIVKGYTIEDFIRQNRKMLMDSKILITYKHSDSYVGISRMIEKFPIKPYVIPEIELVAFGFEGKSIYDERVTCIKNDEDYCIFETGGGMCEILEAGSNELYSSRTTSDSDVNKKFKLSSSKTKEFLFKGVIKWMELFVDIKESLLLSCFPTPVYIGKLQEKGVSHCETLLPPNFTIPCKRSTSINLDKNEKLFIGIENRQLSIDLEEKFGYIPSSLEVIIDVSAGQLMTITVKDRKFSKEINVALGNIR